MSGILAAGLARGGGKLVSNTWFGTITLELGEQRDNAYEAALALGINLRKVGAGKLGITCDEKTCRQDILDLGQASLGADNSLDLDAIDSPLVANGSESIPAELVRTSAILSHPVFNTHHSETEMLRYLKRLENKDISLTHAMIALGSCTMKLNATAEMIPVSWPEFANLHPFAPIDQAAGYSEMIN